MYMSDRQEKPEQIWVSLLRCMGGRDWGWLDMKIKLEIMSQEEIYWKQRLKKIEIDPKYSHLSNQWRSNPVPKGCNPARFSIQQVDNTSTTTSTPI